MCTSDSRADEIYIVVSLDRAVSSEDKSLFAVLFRCSMGRLLYLLESTIQHHAPIVKTAEYRAAKKVPAPFDTIVICVYSPVDHIHRIITITINMYFELIVRLATEMQYDQLVLVLYGIEYVQIIS